MKKKTVFIIGVIMSVLIFGHCAQGGASVVANGSFEDDGLINDIMVKEPNGWYVDMSADQFDGWVDSTWVTDGSYGLAIFSYWYTDLYADDIAIISQTVCLTDVNEIIFDLKLKTYPASNPWDPDKRTAILMIDDEIVWNSDDYLPDSNGEYHNQVVDIDVEDTAVYVLSLGMRTDVNEAAIDVDTLYYTHWDSVGFDLYCEGFGFMEGDFNRDCSVDMDDMEMFADKWLAEVNPNDKYNLYWRDDMEPFGIINFLDFAAFAETWDGDLSELGMFTEAWLSVVDPEDEYNLYRGDDTWPLGVVNFRDFTVFGDNWQMTYMTQ